jgi:hypothetical protein
MGAQSVLCTWQHSWGHPHLHRPHPCQKHRTKGREEKRVQHGSLPTFLREADKASFILPTKAQFGSLALKPGLRISWPGAEAEQKPVMAFQL